MLARLAREVPEGDLLYEPKWDGFRCLAFVDGGAVDLESRHGRPLARYFPEIVGALVALPRPAVLDGELVVPRAGGLAFEPLLARLHPSASRVARLARETPAALVVFDLLAEGDEDLTALPLSARHARLGALLAGAPAPLRRTPSTRDPAAARAWLAAPPASGIDGVVAKPRSLPYAPGRRGWIKVKRERTVDCVVGGFRAYAGAPLVASLLLGLWDAAGRLVHVGVSSSFGDGDRRALHARLAPLAVPLAGHPWEHGFNLGASPVGRLAGSAGRWDPAVMSLDWTAVAPESVVEVAYDRLDGLRFRHPARLVRFRPDREARSCALDQLADPPEVAAATRPP
jgi:ATP-dependent DNA ligase